MPPDSSPCGGCTRRDFLASGTLAAVATLLAGCSASDSTSPFSGTFSVKLADYPALATVGGMAQVSSTGAPVAVVRSSTASYRAFSLRCPHEGATVQVSGGMFRCPLHGATFNSSGSWTGGQPARALTEYKATLNAAGDTLTIGG